MRGLRVVVCDMMRRRFCRYACLTSSSSDREKSVHDEDEDEDEDEDKDEDEREKIFLSGRRR